LNAPATHIAYADEAQYNYGRIRGVGMMSAQAGVAQALAGEVRELLDGSGVRECKWEKIRSARGRFAAQKLLDWAIAAVVAGRLRVDVLTWDVDLSGAEGMPALARLHVMYRRLLEEILPQRWPIGSTFAVFPDEQSAMRWSRLVEGVEQVVVIEPHRSEDEPLIQVADLFTGLGVYSRGNYAVYNHWLCTPHVDRAAHRRQPALPFSASDRVRCALLDAFFTASKFQWLGVSLRTHGGLRTYGAERPIAFWWAEA
jgi:hypothetical protein